MNFSKIKTTTSNSGKTELTSTVNPEYNITLDDVSESNDSDYNPVDDFNDFESFLIKISNLLSSGVVSCEQAARMAIIEMKLIFIKTSGVRVNDDIAMFKEMDSNCWSIIEPLLSFTINYHMMNSKNPYADIYSIRSMIQRIFYDACNICGFKYETIDDYGVIDAIKDFFLIFGYN